MASPTNREEVAAQRQAVTHEMIASVVRGEAREYYVGVVGYYIEGTPHAATGLSLNRHTPPEIAVTDENFTCMAFFQPRELD